jgi:hypothetical protein
VGLISFLSLLRLGSLILEEFKRIAPFIGSPIVLSADMLPEMTPSPLLVNEEEVRFISML